MEKLSFVHLENQRRKDLTLLATILHLFYSFSFQNCSYIQTLLLRLSLSLSFASKTFSLCLVTTSTTLQLVPTSLAPSAKLYRSLVD